MCAGVVQRKRMGVKEKLIKELYEGMHCSKWRVCIGRRYCSSINRLCAGVENAADSGTILSQLLSMMQLARLEEEVYPRIHGMVFKPKNGHLKKLPINCAKRVGSLDHIYGLYGR